MLSKLYFWVENSENHLCLKSMILPKPCPFYTIWFYTTETKSVYTIGQGYPPLLIIEHDNTWT